MPQSKYYHTQSSLAACGGVYSDTRRNCIKFEDGSWTTLTDNLVEKREYHSSWITPDGDILLIGGDYSRTTTEIVYQNGTSIRSFDLKYDIEDACSIELPEMFILTGGVDTLTTVSRYSTSGWMEDLPELNEGRSLHGCGYYFNGDMERVFLVAGGSNKDSVDISSTETLVEGGTTWNFQKPLPSERKALRGVSLVDRVIMTGGTLYGTSVNKDVLMFDPKTSNWTKTGTMKSFRFYHGASLIKFADVSNYCN